MFIYRYRFIYTPANERDTPIKQQEERNAEMRIFYRRRIGVFQHDLVKRKQADADDAQSFKQQVVCVDLINMLYVQTVDNAQQQGGYTNVNADFLFLENIYGFIEVQGQHEKFNRVVEMVYKDVVAFCTGKPVGCMLADERKEKKETENSASFVQ